MLNDASDASKEADRYWMGGLWQDYLAEIAGLRKIDAATISDDIAHYDERVAAHEGRSRQARARAETRRPARDARRCAQVPARERRRRQATDGFRQVDFKNYLAMLAARRPVAFRLAGRRRRRAGRDRSRRAAARHGRRPLDRAARARGARGRSRQGARAARRFARRRCVFVRADPPRSRADARGRQAGRRLDGRRRRERRLLDRDGRRRDLGRADDDHGLDRHLRPRS